jgi:hypothetical protein
MEAIRSSETSVDVRSTQRHIPEDHILHSHRCESLKPYIEMYSVRREANSICHIFYVGFRHTDVVTIFKLSPKIHLFPLYLPDQSLSRSPADRFHDPLIDLLLQSTTRPGKHRLLNIPTCCKTANVHRKCSHSKQLVLLELAYVLDPPG